MGDRRYLALHTLDAKQSVPVLVRWDGQDWKVTIDGDLLADCCSTIEEAFSVAELEIARRFPGHVCGQCRPWEPAPDS